MAAIHKKHIVNIATQAVSERMNRMIHDCGPLCPRKFTENPQKFEKDLAKVSVRFVARLPSLFCNLCDIGPSGTCGTYIFFGAKSSDLLLLEQGGFKLEYFAAFLFVLTSPDSRCIRHRFPFYPMRNV